MPPETDPPPRVIRLRNHLEELNRLHPFVAQFCDAGGLPSNDAFALSLALDELVTNVIVHGYGDHAEHEIQVALSMAGGDVVVEMEDDARPFDPTQPTAVDLAADLEHRKVGGLGLHFVQRAMDEMTYRRTGRHNHLRIKKRIDYGSAKRG
ncbi:MAG: ATP-binding protein [Deltaproteobacteria bacterium]|nr:ATP-binding protein [Deltaproteobacteria bacterium]MBI3390679.1 ATP-binding protein [Deltaproteobacteria bacterium]